MGELQLGDLAVDLEHYLSGLSERCTSARRAKTQGTSEGRETLDLFTLLAEPWSETEVQEFLTLVKIEEPPGS
jgi:hypothetical protein